ncbi:MAG: hypothetical protein IPK67_18330 [Planctomycetes bacterium]|nr:hypothetical protein [Planctomycetota bacterium]
MSRVGHVGFDIAYTMDNLNRLTVADEGTFSGGSITSRTRGKMDPDRRPGTGRWTSSA